MLYSNKLNYYIIASLLLVLGIFLFAGCSQKSSDSYTTTQYGSFMDDEEIVEDNETTTNTTFKTTQSMKKDWKEAYIDYIYELEDTYDNVAYFPCEDFTGDGISDFICAVSNDDNNTSKEIAVAYYNGGVGTLSSDIGFLGVDSENNYLLLSADDDANNWSIDDDKMKYYKFKNGVFVFEKIDKHSEYWADHLSTGGMLKYEMINSIKNGDF